MLDGVSLDQQRGAHAPVIEVTPARARYTLTFVQDLVPSDRRGVATALPLFLMGVIGSGPRRAGGYFRAKGLTGEPTALVTASGGADSMNA
jgi:hypothetical protein